MGMAAFIYNGWFRFVVAGIAIPSVLAVFVL